MKIIAKIAYQVIAELDGAILTIHREPEPKDPATKQQAICLNKAEAQNLVIFIQKNMLT